MALEHAHWFQELSRVDQARLLGRMRRVALGAGETLFNQGDEGETLFVVAEGQIEIVATTPLEHVFAVLNAGEMFGEMALLTGNPRSASARAATAAVVYEIDRETFLDCLATHRSVSAYLLNIFSDRLAVANRNLQDARAGITTPAGDGARESVLARKHREQEASLAQAEQAGGVLRPSQILNALAVALAFALMILFSWVLEPFAGLGPKGMIFIGISLGSILFWVVDVAPDYVVALFMGAFWIASGVATPATALSGFAMPVWLFLIFIFALGVAMARTGLLYRLSLNLLRKFPKTYLGQMGGIAVGGVLFAPLLPSDLAKASLGTPIAWSIAEAMGFKPHSRGAAGLGLTATLFFGFLSPFFLTGSFVNILAFGLVPGATVSWPQWLLYSLPALVVFTLCSFGLLYWRFRPREAYRPLSDEVIAAQLDVLGPLSHEEKITIGVAAGAIGMLILQGWHGIDGAWIALAAFTVLHLTKVLPRQTLKEDFDWGFFLFIGMAFSFATVAADSGVLAWVGATVAGSMGALVQNAYVFLPAVALGTLLLAFIVRDDPAFILLTVTLAPLGASQGYHPWVVVFVILATLSPFFFPYQSPVYLASYYGVGGKAFTHQQARTGAFIYAGSALLAIGVSIPWWKVLGLW